MSAPTIPTDLVPAVDSIPANLLPYFLGLKKDYSSVQGSIITVNIIFLSLICLTTGLRFWVRIFMLRAAGLDDILMLIALVFAILLSVSCLIGHHFGLGKHIWNLTPNLLDLPADTGRVTKDLYGCYLAYATAIAFTKFSIMATYFRIFSSKGALRKVVIVIAVIVLCFWICSIFAIIFTCVPVQASWDYTIKGKCYPLVNFFYVSSAFNIATDLVLCFLPIPTLWALNMSTAQRVVLCALFSGGTFACVASIMRFTQLHHLAPSIIDISYQVVSSLNWSIVEVGSAIICASLSSLRPLATRALPRLFSQFPTATHTSTQKPTKLRSSQTISHISSTQPIKDGFQQPTVIALKDRIPTPGFTKLKSQEERWASHAWRQASDGMIVVEQTFDVTELKGFSSVSVTEAEAEMVQNWGGGKQDRRVFEDTAKLFGDMSQEDLGDERRPRT